MNHLTKLIGGLVVAGIAVAGCCEPAPVVAPEPKSETFTLTVRVTEDEEGRLAIEKFHTEELVAVHDGDRLKWDCEWIASGSPEPCPEEIAFSVRKIHHLANLSWEGEEKEVEERVTDFLERFESAVEGESAEGRRAIEEMMADLPPEAFEALETLESVTDPFAAKFNDVTTHGAGSIISPPYGEFENDHLWKFEWAVARGDDSDSWDPHFRGHRRR